MRDLFWAADCRFLLVSSHGRDQREEASSPVTLIKPPDLFMRTLLPWLHLILITSQRSYLLISSVQFSCSVMSDSLRPHGLQHTRLPCPSPHPRACSNSCPWSQWCHPTISSCHPLFLLPSIFPSIRVFSNELALCIRWPKYWSFSFSISPSNEYSRLISFRMGWFVLLAVQGTLKSLL